MRAETRHQLKQDRFSRATIDAAGATVHWTVEHKSKLVIGAIVVLVVLAAGSGAWFYLNQQDQKASVELNQAVRTLDTPLRPPGFPAEADSPTFTSSKDRAAQAHKQFQTIADKYPHTRSGEIARYFVGLTSEQMGDDAAAERELKTVASAHNEDLSGLAKFALASVYRNRNRNQDAIDLYQQLIAKPSHTVGKVTAQLELAATYQSAQRLSDAKHLYEQIQKENPAGEAAQLAAAKLQELK